MVDTLSATLSAPLLPWDEPARLAALDSYDILDTPREADFDDIATLAAAALGAPIGVVNLIGDGRQWFKAETGIGTRELPLDVSICAHAFLQRETMIVPDTRLDGRFACNPLVAVESGLRFYAGAMLLTPTGLPLGTVCVLDRVPRPGGITGLQKLTLEVLARQVMTQLELRRLLAQKHRDEKELRDSELRGRIALDAAKLGAWEAVPGARQIHGDARVCELLGLGDAGPIPFDAFLDCIHALDRDRVAAAVEAALTTGTLDIDYRTAAVRAEPAKWLRSRAQLCKAPGERLRLIGTVRDISAERAAEAHRQLLGNELQHRVKNTLSVVQGIVNHSLRTVATPAEARDVITSRLSTLAHAHDALTQTSWTAAPIAAVVEGAVLAHCSQTSRVTTDGPMLSLKARAALALSMVLHELFTNAVKYGSLSNHTGVVTLTWTISDNADGDRRLDFLWQEAGGPPVGPPSRIGFGTRLTSSSLAVDLGGVGVVDYAPAGLCWRLSADFAAIVEEPGAADC
ncbi:MAG: histidine kinase [Alphaproteobacteria bacterium]|nr:MAG: histidine kinase [Alphaproteobacteria bacterium]